MALATGLVGHRFPANARRERVRLTAVVTNNRVLSTIRRFFHAPSAWRLVAQNQHLVIGSVGILRMTQVVLSPDLPGFEPKVAADLAAIPTIGTSRAFSSLGIPDRTTSSLPETAGGENKIPKTDQGPNDSFRQECVAGRIEGRRGANTEKDRPVDEQEARGRHRERDACDRRPGANVPDADGRDSHADSRSRSLCGEGNRPLAAKISHQHDGFRFHSPRRRGLT